MPEKNNVSKPSHDELAKTKRCFNSVALFDGQKQIYINHEGLEYVLRVTNQGKLILTK